MSVQSFATSPSDENKLRFCSYDAQSAMDASDAYTPVSFVLPMTHILLPADTVEAQTVIEYVCDLMEDGFGDPPRACRRC